MLLSKPLCCERDHGDFGTLSTALFNRPIAALLAVSIRQHTSAYVTTYVSIRQHTSAYASIRLLGLFYRAIAALLAVDPQATAYLTSVLNAALNPCPAGKSAGWRGGCRSAIRRYCYLCTAK